VKIVLSLAVAGVMVGTLYGLVGLTLTLMFRSTGVLSFAHAGFAIVASYMYVGFSCRTGSALQCGGDPLLPPYPAAFVSIVTVTVVALVMERLVIWPLRYAGSTVKSIATAAILGLCSGVMLQIYGPQPRNVPAAQQLVPSGGFTLFDVVVNWQRASIFVVSVALVVVLSVLLRRTWFGLGLRAAGQSSDTAQLMGVKPRAVSRFNWALAGALSGLAGVLIAPITLVNIGTFSFLLVKAVGATLIGGLVSLPITFAGGIALGLAEALVPHYWETPGSADVVIAASVVAILYLNRRRFSLYSGTGGAAGRGEAAPAGRLSVAVARALCGVELLVQRVPRPVRFLALLPPLVLAFTDEYYAAVGLNVIYYALMALSLLVITGLVGKPSLMQVAFAGVGAYSVGTALGHGISIPGGMLIGIVLCFALGLAVGYVSLPFRGVEFAIVSLSLAAAASGFVFWRPSLGNNIVAPDFFGIDLLKSRNAFAVMAVLTALAFLTVGNLRRCGWGRLLPAIEEGKAGLLRHAGVNPTLAEVFLFAVSAAIAGLAGCAYALVVNLFNAGQFIPLLSITILLAAVVGGLRSLWGPVLAGVLFGYGPTLVQQVSVNSANAYPQILASLLALVLVVRVPGGLASLFSWAREETARSGVVEREAAPPFRGRALSEEPKPVVLPHPLSRTLDSRSLRRADTPRRRLGTHNGNGRAPERPPLERRTGARLPRT
jgi:sulfate-transporting ATPase